MIEQATVLGWHLVVKKGEFQVGDHCVYCEIDSLLPERAEFEFLRSRHFRIRTIRLRGQISQGIAFPLAILGDHDLDVQAGTDVTEHLGIIKHEPPIKANLRGNIKGPFPGFLIKTNETRIQSAPDVLARHKNVPCNVTEKLDGTSVTYYYHDGEFGVCSRNLELKESETNVYWQVARALDIENKIRSSGMEDVALQGEIIGPGIQKNKYDLEEHKLYIFNVFHTDTYRYADAADARNTVFALDLNSVPLKSAWYKLSECSIDELIENSTARSGLNPSIWQEGVVIRSNVETHDPDLGRLSFKVINPKFLLKHEE